MRILIDLQACQTTSRDRGIGRLSLALARAMASVGNGHEFWLLLNETAADTIAAIVDQFEGLIPRRQIVTFTPMLSLSRWNLLRRRKPNRDQVIRAVDPDVIHVASVFEPVESPIRGGKIPTAATLYDLIPLVHPKQYLNSPVASTWYHGKLKFLKRADLLLAISDHSRSEAITYLNMRQDRIATIDAGIDPCFTVVDLTADEKAEIAARIGVDRPFVMYAGSHEWRKNMKGLIEAFALLPAAVRADYQLVIVCPMEPHHIARLRQEVARLGLGERDVVFTGFLPDADLIKLYNLCHLFVFPSLHEGFGLPIVEAMACGAPVIGSNSTSVPEIIGRPDALFDPTQPTAIADAMARALTDEEFRQSLRRHGLVQARHFTWENSARRALAALENLAG